MKAVAAMDSGTTAAAVPMLLPATSRVNGTMATIRMMNGTDRTALTSSDTGRCTRGRAASPPGAVTSSSTASGRPNSTAMVAAAQTMAAVSQKASTIRACRAGDSMAAVLGDAAASRQGAYGRAVAEQAQ